MKQHFPRFLLEKRQWMNWSAISLDPKQNTWLLCCHLQVFHTVESAQTGSTNNFKRIPFLLSLTFPLFDIAVMNSVSVKSLASFCALLVMDYTNFLDFISLSSWQENFQNPNYSNNCPAVGCWAVKKCPILEPKVLLWTFYHQTKPMKYDAPPHKFYWWIFRA